VDTFPNAMNMVFMSRPKSTLRLAIVFALTISLAKHSKIKMPTLALVPVIVVKTKRKAAHVALCTFKDPAAFIAWIVLAMATSRPNKPFHSMTYISA
jgi:hypothetical protein